MLKRVFIMIMVLMLAIVNAAYAVEGECYQYCDGEKIIILSAEDQEWYSQIAAQAYENAPEVLKTSQLTLEQRAQETQLLSEEERAYTTLWGLPQGDDISQETALYLSYAYLQEACQMEDKELASLFPVFTFEITDPEAPVWCIKFMPLDAETQAVIVVKIYAGSGCLAELGIRETVG